MGVGKTEINTKIGRIPILDVRPAVAASLWPAKAYVGEVIPFSATIFREGHDLIGAELSLVSPTGEISRFAMREIHEGSDKFSTRQLIDEEGTWLFSVHAYADDFASWHHSAKIKLAIGIDEELMILEAVALFERALREKARSKPSEAIIKDLLMVFTDKKISPREKLKASEAAAVKDAFAAEPIRSLETESEEHKIYCERALAGAGSWYEFFPRSEGAKQDPKTGVWKSGNFQTASERLLGVAEMGFDVLYLPPIHPIGVSHRKGQNNSLTAKGSDPGSPWAIGSAFGGHDAIHPDLGDESDFKEFVERANAVGLEIALDFALQASPDHPWVKQHPEWFTTRADGSIAYAENPPKKYQDIYPINFDNDPKGIYAEALRIVQYWISLGVKIFRVDNPHTKPVNFWEWLIAEVNRENPEVIFLAEAFTRPAIMHTLGKIGFQQSYTYFTWRNSKDELESYLTELSHGTAEFFRPNLWVSTPDILSQYLQFGGRPAHKIRAALAATGAPSWGMYAGYELCEAVARAGVDEHIDSEKYQYKPRNWDQAEAEGTSLAPYIAKLNQIRKDHPALMQLRNFEIHWSDDSEILVFSKHLNAEHSPDNEADTVIVVANLDPYAARETSIHLDLEKLGLAGKEKFMVQELITGEKYEWTRDNFVRLDAFKEPVHILSIVRG